MTAKENQAVRVFRNWPLRMRREVRTWICGAVCGHASTPKLSRGEKRRFRHWWHRYFVG